MKNLVKDMSMKDPIPSSIEPWLTVRDSKKAVEFYKNAFGATEVYRLEAPDGGLVAKLTIDSAAFWVGNGSPENSVPESPDGGNVRMILIVTDPDALFIRAVNAGATVVFPVGEQHGWRLGRLADPFGLHWEIGRPVTKG